MRSPLYPVKLQLYPILDTFDLRSRYSAQAYPSVLQKVKEGRVTRKLNVIVIAELLLELAALPQLFSRAEPLLVQLFRFVVSDAVDGHEGAERLVAGVLFEVLCRRELVQVRRRRRRRKWDGPVSLIRPVCKNSSILMASFSPTCGRRGQRDEAARKGRKSHLVQLFPRFSSRGDPVRTGDDCRHSRRVRDSFGAIRCAARNGEKGSMQAVP